MTEQSDSKNVVLDEFLDECRLLANQIANYHQEIRRLLTTSENSDIDTAVLAHIATDTVDLRSAATEMGNGPSANRVKGASGTIM